MRRSGAALAWSAAVALSLHAIMPLPNHRSAASSALWASTAAPSTRRGWLRWAFSSLFGWGMAAFGAAVALWTAGTWRFLMPNVVTEPAQRFRVGPPQNYPPGYVETRFKDRFGVWVVHGTCGGQEQIFALRTTCTHLGCITLWLPAEQKFKCPCHGSGFDRTGFNREGPAPRPLERYAIRLAEDGQLEVDLSRTFQQELGQWDDPQSYVRV